MTARRLISVLSVGLLASASMVAAQPAKKAPASGKKAPPAPAKGSATPAKDSGAKDSAAKPGGAQGSTAKPGGPAGPAAPGGGEGSAVQMTEDPPPSDPNGTDENPHAPRSMLETETPAVSTAAPAKRRTGYPIEEVARPITLPQNTSEVSIAPHAMVSPFAGAMPLRARYGITPKIQAGLTYMLGGLFDDPSTAQSKQALHSGKAVGVDVTVMLQDWVGARLGVPIYISPLAVSLTLGAPLKFTFGDKLALGGLDDLLNIRLSRFAPTFYQELQNATNANNNMTNTIKSRGELRVSLYGAYQYRPNLAIIGRTGIQMEDFATGKTDGCPGECLTTFISAGFTMSPRKYLDLGLAIGFDDLAHGGSFAPTGYLAFRI